MQQNKHNWKNGSKTVENVKIATIKMTETDRSYDPKSLIMALKLGEGA